MFVNLQQLARLAAQLPDGWEKHVKVSNAIPPVTATVLSPVLGIDVDVTLDNAHGEVDGVEATCTCGAKEPCLHMAAVYRYVSEIPIDSPPEETPKLSANPEPKAPPAPVNSPNETATATATATLALPEPSKSFANVELVLTPEQLVSRHKQLTELITKALQEGRDYGLIPGTNKPSLWKAGAERVAVAFGSYPKYFIIEKQIDHNYTTVTTQTRWVDTAQKPSKADAAALKAARQGRWFKKDTGWVWQTPKGTKEVQVKGLYRYIIQCSLISRVTGTEIGAGLAVCSSLEPKYSSRPHSVENTILKMAEKRAFVGTVLNTFGLSDRYTQDVEDFN